MLKVIIFDLDGTLANTKNLTQSRRVPAQVLELSQPMDPFPELLMGTDFQFEIATLLRSSIPVYIITRSPLAYASTLVFLLGIDFEELIPSSTKFPTPQSKIQNIIDRNNCTPAEALYIGDTNEDFQIARNMGIMYQDINEVLGLSGKSVSHYQNLVKHCEEADVSESKTSKVLLANQKRSDDWRELIFKIVQKESTNTVTPRQSLSELADGFDGGIYPFHDEYNDELNKEILKPFIHPRFVSRYQYDTDPHIKMNLFQMLINLGYGPKLLEPPYKFSILESSYKIEVFAHYKYSDKSQWWKFIKDWKISYSGPEPKLHNLEFVALTMSAPIYFEEDPTLLIIPIPSSPFSTNKPAEVSLRLAYRVSQLSEVPLENIFVKKDKNIVLLDPNYNFDNIKDRKVILLDDQLTEGKHALDCINILLENGINKIKVHTWTSTKFNLKIVEKKYETTKSNANENKKASKIIDFLKYREQILYNKKVEEREEKLAEEPAYLLSIPNAGWTWYCDYHEAFGLADTEHEALWMGGAHLHYHEDDESCTMSIKEW